MAPGLLLPSDSPLTIPSHSFSFRTDRSQEKATPAQGCLKQGQVGKWSGMVEAGQSVEQLPKQPQRCWKPTSWGKRGLRKDRALTAWVTRVGDEQKAKIPLHSLRGRGRRAAASRTGGICLQDEFESSSGFA